MKLLVFWYCDSFCDSQMLHLVGSYNPAKIYLGIFWRVIMFGCYTVTEKYVCVSVTQKSGPCNGLVLTYITLNNDLTFR